METLVTQFLGKAVKCQVVVGEALEKFAELLQSAGSPKWPTWGKWVLTYLISDDEVDPSAFRSYVSNLQKHCAEHEPRSFDDVKMALREAAGPGTTLRHRAKEDNTNPRTYSTFKMLGSLLRSHLEDQADEKIEEVLSDIREAGIDQLQNHLQIGKLGIPFAEPMTSLEQHVVWVTFSDAVDDELRSDAQELRDAVATEWRPYGHESLSTELSKVVEIRYDVEALSSALASEGTEAILALPTAIEAKGGPFWVWWRNRTGNRDHGLTRHLKSGEAKLPELVHPPVSISALWDAGGQPSAITQNEITSDPFDDFMRPV